MHVLCALPLRGSLWTIIEIISNALVCALVAWVANYVWSVGNFFSGMSAAHQTRVTFLAAALGTSHIISGAMTVVAQAHVLCSFRFANCPSQPPRLAFCVLALLRETWVMFVATELVMVVSVYVVSLGPIGMREYKVEFYLACFAGHALTAAVATSTRLIIKTQTVQGQRASLQRAVESMPATATAKDDGAQQSEPSRVDSVARCYASCARRSMSRVVRYSKAYLKSYQGELPVIISGLYVQLTIYFGIPTDAVGLLIFAVGSLVLKVLAQEGAKVMLTKKKAVDIRTMCVAIGLPPILIDTQIRIVLQYAQSTTVAATGILGLGVVEIAMRVSKLLWLKAQIRRRSRVQLNSVSPGPVNTTGGDQEPQTERAPGEAIVGGSDAWERRLWQLHTAELYTDMSAEYMAISCSTLFLYFFGTHPKYMLERTLSSLASGSSSSTAATVTSPSTSTTSDWSMHISSSMAIQLAVEVLVDFCSCIVEISAGTDFAQLRKYRYFVVSFLANLAVANLQIAGVMYILASS